ncbi:MAG: exo-alpha-sialidase [Clostridia bacterium]|nr:exo-alpha-sialidase [Clostridia bacterium]
MKNKIKNMQKTIGTHVNLNDIAVSKIVGQSGYDFIWIDLEHSYLSLENLMAHIIAIKAGGTSVIVRVPQDDLTYTKKVLEMGVDGIIFPMVKTVEEANRLIASTLYPPYGTRGFGPMNAVGFGKDNVMDYVKNTKDNLCRFIQIEHIETVENLEEIVKNEFIDGYIFGPNDLSGSINELCEVFNENTTSLIKRSIDILKKANKYIGLSTGDTRQKTLTYWANFDINMLSAGSDFGILQENVVKNRKNLELAMQTPHAYLNKVNYTKNSLSTDVNCSMLPPQIYGVDAFESDHFSAEKRKWQSAPCVCKAYGKLFCTFSGDNYGGDEEPNNYNAIMVSEDNGENWKPLFIFDHADSVRLHEPILWVGKDGALRHFWAQSYEHWDGRGGVWCTKILPTNNGYTYTSPKRLCDGVLATPPITKENGNILMPVSIWHRWKNTIHSYPFWGESAIYESEDNGESYRYVGGVRDNNSIFDENAIVERKDGSLFMIIRCDSYIAKTVSYDGGKSWTQPQKLMDHTSARSYLAKLPSGNYLLVTNNNTKARSYMTAFISTDECNTFTPSILLDERYCVSYPAGCVTEEGRVYVAYDFNRYQEEEIYLASFSDQDLENGSIINPDSFIKKLAVKGKNGKIG